MNRPIRRPPHPRRIAALLLAAVATACAAPPHPAPALPTARAAPPAASAEAAPQARVVRTYRDERGQLWDDQGRRVDEPR